MEMTIEQQRVMRIATKLLALANGTASESEAMSATLKAHALLDQYDLDIADIGKYEKEARCSERGAILKGKSVPFWAHTLAKGLMGLYSCKALLASAPDGKSKVLFVGVEPQASICLHSFIVVYRYLETQKHQNKTIKLSYSVGFVEALICKLQTQKAAQSSTATSTALVPIRTALAEQYVADKYKKLKLSRATSGNLDERAFAQGGRDGREYNIAAGINTAASHSAIRA